MKPIYFLFAFFILFLFQACQDLDTEPEDFSNINNTDIVEEIKDWYEQKPSGGSNQRNIRDLSSINAHWQAAKTHKKDKDHYMTTVPLSIPNQGVSTLQLVAFRDKEKVQGFIIQTIPTKGHALNNAKGVKEKFSGEVKLISKSGKKLKTFKFKDGTKQTINKVSSTFRTMNEGDMWEVDAGYEIEIIGYQDSYDGYIDYIWFDAQSFDWNNYYDGATLNYEDFNNDGYVDVSIPVQSIIVVGGADSEKIINPVQHLKCFNRNSPATVTIFADQPIPGNDASYNGTNVGHSFITIKQGDITRTVGYYPQGTAIPGYPSSPGVLVDNSEHIYNVGVSMAVSAQELTQLLNYITNQTSTTYNINSNNCTSFVMNACAAMGINLPQSQTTWPGGGGVCPGTFGEDLRNFSAPGRWTSHFSNDAIRGTAPENTGNCN